MARTIAKARLERMLAKVEREMERQTEQGMERGWPVLFWDKTCVERNLLRQLLGKKRKQFNPADIMAGW